MRVAIYRVLYGEDYIAESIESILPIVDHVIIAKAERPWGTSTGVTYKGEWVPWPAKFDNTREKVAALGRKNVYLVDDFWPTTAGQVQHIVNDIVLQKFPKTDEIMFIEPDHVFTPQALLKTIREWNARPELKQASTRMIELWKTPAWRIPERQRPSVIFYRIKGSMPETTNITDYLQAEVHNCGFAMSDRLMYWKHLTAMAFASEINDCPPDPDWLDRWINWKPEDRNLEISLGCQHLIPQAFPYDWRQAPLPVAEKFLLKEFGR